jgi:flagellar biosynthesis/type III secretory pathway M-ring protein FliF/YscJ
MADSKFTNIEFRAIKNNGKINITNTSFENKTKLQINQIINDTTYQTLNNYIYKFLILLVLIIPFIWVTYYFLAKYLKHLERKSEENV